MLTHLDRKELFEQQIKFHQCCLRDKAITSSEYRIIEDALYCETNTHLTRKERDDLSIYCLKSDYTDPKELDICTMCDGVGHIDKCATDPKTDKIHYWEIPCPYCFGQGHN